MLTPAPEAMHGLNPFTTGRIGVKPTLDYKTKQVSHHPHGLYGDYVSLLIRLSY